MHSDTGPLDTVCGREGQRASYTVTSIGIDQDEMNQKCVRVHVEGNQITIEGQILNARSVMND